MNKEMQEKVVKLIYEYLISYIDYNVLCDLHNDVEDYVAWNEIKNYSNVDEMLEDLDEYFYKLFKESGNN